MLINRHPRRNAFLLPLILLAVFVITSCQKQINSAGEPAATHDLTIKFTAIADAQALKLGNTYTNAWGEDYTPTAFKFYIAQIKLVNTDSGIVYNVNKDEYFLVNFEDSASVSLKLKAVPATYNRIAFLIGVDSIRNVSGAQTGALDPGKGMFWTWNSGYIMAKLEGNSPASIQPNNKFEFHIGGFSGADNVLKTVSLPFPSGEFVSLQANRSSQMTIAANANAWFMGANQIKIGLNAVVTTPGPLAKQVADNYAGMFSVTGIVN